MKRKNNLLFSRNLILVICLLFILSSCNLTKKKYLDPNLSIEERVKDLVARMTLEEKIGQITQVDRTFLKAESDITKYYLGSVLAGGNSGPKINNTPETWADLNDTYQNQALKTRLKIPLLFGIDAVHGNSQSTNTVIFPHNIGLGCTSNPELIKKAARITAIETIATGVNWNFSPCIAVVKNEKWGRTYESFSEDTEVVTMMGTALIQGYHGSETEKNESMIACAKHYLGDGATLNGKDQGNLNCDEVELREKYLKPYIAAINNNVDTIMVSFSSWNGEKLHGHKYLINDILKEELGFKGIVVSDWGGYKQLADQLPDQILLTINAGVDMVMVPDIYPEFISTFKELVTQGKISHSRINDAVERIIRVKIKNGLFENSLAKRTLLMKVGSAEHREIGRQCVRESTVLLKNAKKTLPLSKNIKKIHVVGKNANDLGYQCGGWTLSWQGTSGDITTGTTILEGILEVAKNTEVTYSIDGTETVYADAYIVVVGETPYAEFQGDSEDLSLSDLDLGALNRVKKYGKPVIVVLITGRPLIITNQLKDWDALLCAWLPGTEGAGVADIIFGDYSPTGRLSYTWPKNMDQLPINIGDEEYDPLFPFGYGLSYTK